MKNNLLFNFSVNRENNTIHIQREFNADLELVWKAWTEQELLDQWWAPEPYRSQTKMMQFKEGGYRLYAMVSPENHKHWGREDYQSIVSLKSFSASKTFCDENGYVAAEVPRSLWGHRFKQESDLTIVNIRIQYENADHLQKMIEMGFKEGFTAGLNQLQELIETFKKNKK